MLDLMSTAKNAIETYNAKLRTTSANIANMAVTGYKRLEVSFQAVFNQVLRQGSGSTAETGGVNPTQSGGGVAIASTSIDFSQGDLIGGGALDLAVVGDGLMIVSPDAGETFLYTRAGDFNIDSQGKLVAANGMQVYGFACSASGTPDTASLVPLTSSHPATGATSSSLGWDSSGYFGATFTDPITGITTVTTPYYQAALSTFENTSGLQLVDGTTYGETLASGEPTTPAASGTGNLGSVSPGQLEQSNVFYIGETIDAMEMNRAMSGNLTALRMINDAITQFINRLG